MREFLVERAAEGSGRRLVYVSCNPKAAAADLEVLVEGGFHVLGARPVDLFPHTPHLEVVFTLEWRGPRTDAATEGTAEASAEEQADV